MPSNTGTEASSAVRVGAAVFERRLYESCCKQLHLRCAAERTGWSL